ncbi:AmmeMemoRadiSam system protein B, partial [Myxococcota bacterium]|nr:AmmeMemoRadiSam system protein B [Myxococcota bacterium]
MGSVRKSAVAGQFYPGDAVRLEKEVDACLLGVSKGEQPLAGFVPHAGYLYSGKCAGVFYGSLSHVPPLVVLLGPNHTGLGSSIAISGHSGWE